jgi:two-component system response regulator HydG
MIPRVLVVDDDEGVRYMLRGFLEDMDLAVTEAEDGAQAILLLGSSPFDLVISDLRMPRVDGLGLLAHVRALPSPPKLILLTAHGSERAAVEAMKLGAFDYFRKPFEPEELTAVVGRAVEAVRLRAENEKLSGQLNLSRSLLFASPRMAELAVLVQRVAARDVAVLVTGETGTGKERVAEAIVRASPRNGRPFVRFNCAALTKELAESELFGHARGAFTGAQQKRAGLFREADGGTLLLDEIGELDLTLQAKLLRVLQDREVRPVGEDRPVPVDVRVIAATHRDLEKLSRQGLFREDLYYRLRVVRLAVPALRERPEDIPLLAAHFVESAARRFGLAPPRLPDALVERLLAHAWPGNVRELENTMESLVAMSPEGTLDEALLSLPSSSNTHPRPDEGAESPLPGEPAPALKRRVDAYERGLIRAALTQAGGNRSEAARLLGLSRATLHDKLVKHGLGGAEGGG